MTYISEVNKLVEIVVNDCNITNLKILISRLKKLSFEILNFTSYDDQELYDTDIYLYTNVIGDFVPLIFHNMCYHYELLINKPRDIDDKKFNRICYIVRAYESIYQWCMHKLYAIMDTVVFKKS